MHFTQNVFLYKYMNYMPFTLKRLVHPQSKILSSFTHSCVVQNLYGNQKIDGRWPLKKQKEEKQIDVSQWLPSTVLPTFFKISYFVFNRQKKLIKVWN